MWKINNTTENFVSLRYTARGSHIGAPHNGIPLTGRRAQWTAVGNFMIDEKTGRIQHWWKDWDKMQSTLSLSLHWQILMMRRLLSQCGNNWAGSSLTTSKLSLFKGQSGVNCTCVDMWGLNAYYVTCHLVRDYVLGATSNTIYTCLIVAMMLMPMS